MSCSNSLIAQKMKENPLLWEIKAKCFLEFKKNFTKFENSEALFKKIIKIEDSSQILNDLMKETFLSHQNIFRSYYETDSIDCLNEFKKKWIEFLKNQYLYLIQNYYIISSETKDETIYFYDSQTLLNLVLKIKTSETVKKIVDCTLTDYNSDSSLKNLKNYCYYDVMEEKEKFLEKMLERKVGFKQIL